MIQTEIAVTPDRTAAKPDASVKKYRPAQTESTAAPAGTQGKTAEIGGRKDGTEPTRFGDWEKQGRCIDF